MKSYLEKMLYELTSAYTRKDYDNCKREIPPETNIGKLFSLFAWGLDSAREQAGLVKLWDNIDNARGAVLDRYGANFGVKRVSSDDRYYRLAIRVKVMAQLSGGDIDTVVWAAATLLEVDAPDMLLEEIYPAKIALYVDMALLSPGILDLIEEVARAIKRILAAGVGMRLYLRTYRTYRSVLTFSQGAYILAGISAVPVGQDREASLDVLLSQGAFQKPGLTLSRPDVRKACTARQESAGGAMCHAHIRAKRTG